MRCNLLHVCSCSWVWFCPIVCCTETPGTPRKKIAVSTLALADNDSPPSPKPGSGSQPLSQRKKLLKAPTLAELESSDSEVSVWACICAGDANTKLIVIDTIKSNFCSQYYIWCKPCVILCAVSKGNSVMFLLLRRSLAHTDQSAPPAFLWWTTRLQILSWAKEVCTLYNSRNLFTPVPLYVHVLTVLSLKSPSPVPPDIVHTSAWTSRGCSTETLYREGDSDQRAFVRTTSVELQISSKFCAKMHS